MSQFVIFKRWGLKSGHNESELLELVRKEVIPHYTKLPGCRGLGLLHVRGTRSYLAIQYWESHDAWQETTTSDGYQAWYNEYRRTLERWDRIMEFESEWDTEDVLET